MRKALLVTAEFFPTVSGISTYYYHLFKAYPSKNLIVLTPWAPGCEDFDQRENFRIYRFKAPLGNSLLPKFIRFLIMNILTIWWVFKEKVEVLHCGQVISVGIAAFLLNRLWGLPYCIYLHGGDGEELRRFGLINKLIKVVINSSRATITNSESTKKEFVQLGGKAKKMVVVYPGVDPERFNPNINTQMLRERFNLKDKKVILTVSRLGLIKGHDRVIEALPPVIEKWKNVVYVVVGEGTEKERLQKLTKELNLQDKVILVGYAKEEELPAFFNLCDVFIMTSIHIENKDVEGFGIVYLEAIACQKPVIGSKIGGIPEAVADGICGILVDPHNSQEISRALIKLLDDPEYARLLGERGRQRIEKDFNWKTSIEKFKRILEESCLG